jgi:hypothetical protein
MLRRPKARSAFPSYICIYRTLMSVIIAPTCRTQRPTAVRTDLAFDHTRQGHPYSAAEAGRLIDALSGFHIAQQQTRTLTPLPVVDDKFIRSTQHGRWRSAFVGIEHHGIVHRAVARVSQA